VANIFDINKLLGIEDSSVQPNMSLPTDMPAPQVPQKKINLHQEAKKLLPTVSDEEISSGITKIKEVHPDYSDDEILSAAVQAKAKLSGDYNSDARQGILNKQAQQNNGFDWKVFGAGLASSLAGHGASGSMQALQQREAQQNKELSQFDVGRKQALEDVAAGQDRESLLREQDPNSAESKMAQELAKNMGMKGDLSTLTANKFKNLSPALEMKYKIEENNKNRLESSKQRAFDNSLKIQEKHSLQNEKDFSKMSDSLDPNKGRAGEFGKNQGRINSATRIEALITDSGGNLRNLDQRQIEELAIGTNSLLSGSSSPAVSQVKALVPHTIWGDVKKMQEWLTNNPTGTDQLAFVKRMAETVAREKEVAISAIKKVQISRLAQFNHLKEKDPKQYQNVLSSWGLSEDEINDKGQYKENKPEQTNKPSWAK
jgi:hypothetical protein